MKQDYQVRTMPLFRVTSPILTEEDDHVGITFSIANVSDGTAKQTMHYIVFKMSDKGLFVASNIIVGKGK